MSGVPGHTITLSLNESRDWCRALARRTAGNFYYSFLTLPAEQLRDMCVLYAFMRVSDDLGDDATIPEEERAERLRDWERGLKRALEQGPFEHPVFPALADITARYRIPREHFHSVITGIRMDLNPVRFATFADLQSYCYHVAGVVGLCCIHIWGFQSEDALPLAIECGLAFQLTNILRDLGEDIERGRIYLPQEDLQQFGYTREDIAAHVRDDRFTQLMRFQCERAKEYYRSAERLSAYLAPPGKPILSAMLGIYGGLLRQIEKRGYDVYSQRVRLPAWRKLWIAGRSLLRHRFG